jgi:hypothetical protein
MDSNKGISPKKQKSSFSCEYCHYKCNKNSEYIKHLLTPKHIGNASGMSARKTSSHNKIAKTNYDCKNCEKVYKSRKGLWSHKKICNANVSIKTDPLATDPLEIEDLEIEDLAIEDLAIEDLAIEDDIMDHKHNVTIDEKVNTVITNINELSENEKISLLLRENSDFKSLILEVVRSNTDLQKQNNEMQKQMLEVCKNTNNNTMINSHNNSHNKTFNLMFFLNEQCKDAMNMSEFVESFELNLEDLESVGELGYVEGMTKIFIDKLNSMDIRKRPMHCSDAKREIIYVKDDNRWEREKRDNPKLRKAIKNVSFRNMKLTNLWSDTYPDSKSSESRLNDVYMKLVIESTGGSGEIGISENKIIRRIAKEIVIDKSLL